MILKNITRVLMCRPLYYSVDYVINPWMKPGSVDKNKAMEQWEDLFNTYTSLGITVDVIDQIQGLPDMVFATDQGIVEGNTVLLSNFRYKERQPETDYYKKWFEENNFQILEIRKNDFFEGGGECLPWQDTYFIGTGFRSIPESIQWIEDKLNKKFIRLELINEFFYHLDTCFFPLNNDTAFYYPDAFSSTAISTLIKTIPVLIPFTKEEAYNFCSNSVVTGNKVITQKGSASFQKKLKHCGYEPIELDLSEFVKAGGGIHCLTNILSYY